MNSQQLFDDLYRQEKEEFVSNHGGSTARDVVVAILPNICGVLLHASTLGLVGKYLSRNAQIMVEFCINIVPCVLCYTVLSENIWSVCSSMIFVSMANIGLMFIEKKRSKESSTNDKPLSRKISSSKRPFLTNFRALTNIITAICVLAVDFRVFPRKYAKTEIYGYSLMDTGVGLFVLANAFVAPEARNSVDPRTGQSLTRRMAANSKACVKNCAPLLVLGIGRFFAVEYSNYQKHVSEYGVHWNFFVTLAFVKMLTSTIATAISSRYSLISGLSILAMHEYALGTKGLKDWVLGDSPRDDFVSANREGLVSLPGYVALYRIGIAIGRLVHSTCDNNNNNSKKVNNIMTKHSENGEKVKNSDQPLRYCVNLRIRGFELEFEYSASMILCIKMSLIAAQACAATLFFDNNFGVSRRLANAGYCCWLVTLASAILTLLLLAEIIADIIVNIATGASSRKSGPKNTEKTKKKRVEFDLDDSNVPETRQSHDTWLTPEIFEAVNYNGLAFFLLANLLTGLVNMSVKTLYVSDNNALFIIFFYIAVCVLVPVILYRYKIQIKL